MPTTIVNSSTTPKTIGKGTKVALGTYDFDEFSAFPKESINLLFSPDPLSIHSDTVNVLIPYISHLCPSQFHEARNLLNEFSDIFSLSNTKIAKTTVTEFDLGNWAPISMPLRKVPLH